MFKSRKTGLLLAIFVLLAIVLVACQPEEVEVTSVVEVPVEVTRIVTETVVEEGEQVEVTRVDTVEVVVTATAEPMEEVSFIAEDPSTYVFQTFGDVDTLDPNLAYDSASGALLLQVMEALVFFDQASGSDFVPQLATEVPSTENGLISEDGMSYTFPIREGVTYHEGGTLSPADVAYTFQRGLLQSDPDGPQWLLLEPILGYNNCFDITEGIDPECNLAGDPAALVEGATPEQLVAQCELVKEAIVADDAAGTVTINMVQPWGPLLTTLAGYWGYIIDMEWAIENGAWDGSCDTWQNHYAPGAENTELGSIVNGTGPYMLDNWTPGEGYTLKANPNYWRTCDEPMWEGGPCGVAPTETIVTQIVNEWGTRFASLQAGDATRVSVPAANRPQVDEFVGEFCDWETGACEVNPDNPDGPIRKWADIPSTSRTDVFLNFDIVVDEDGTNPYIGSGQLDGNGIPADFFSDINVRRAMNYCFDWDIYLDEVLNGEGVKNNGPIIKNMLGYNEDGPEYSLDLDACAAELEQAWGGVLPETGFRFQIAYNTGNVTRQTVGEILQANLAEVNELYTIEIIGLPWPSFLRAFRGGNLPAIVSGWGEDIHDPHNWVQPFTVGTYAFRQHMPEDLRQQFVELVNAGVATADNAEREEIYFALQQLHHDEAPQITLAQALGARFEQRYTNGWYYHPINGTYYYAISNE